MNNKLILSLISVFTFAFFVKAQDTITISKASILEKVNDNNLQIKIAEKNAAKRTKNTPKLELEASKFLIRYTPKKAMTKNSHCKGLMVSFK